MDPLRDLEHSHAYITRLALDLGVQLHAPSAAGSAGARVSRRELVRRIESLRDELLRHFADEEEALFPFVRAHVPSKVYIIERLEAAHDAICGGVVRLAHLASRADDEASERQLAAHYDRFARAYAEHSRDEAGLFEELSRELDPRKRAELASLLHGLDPRERGASV